MNYLVTGNGRNNVVRSDFDDLFDTFFNGFGRSVTERTPVVDIRETETEYTLEVELPGIGENDIDISVKDNLLTLKAGKEEKKESKEDKFLVSERRKAVYKRSFVLPNDINGSEIKAKYSDGVLELQIPKKEEAKALSIKVNG